MVARLEAGAWKHCKVSRSGMWLCRRHHRESLTAADRFVALGIRFKETQVRYGTDVDEGEKSKALV